MKPAIVVTLLSLCLLSGCLFTKTTRVSGTYVGTGCPGWKVYSPRHTITGHVYEAPYGGKGMPPRIFIYKVEKGVFSIGFVYIKYPEYNKVTVSFNDRGGRMAVDIDGSEIEVPVGDSEDFTVTVPGYVKGDIVVPPFEARFRWSNKPVIRYDYVGF